MLDTSQMQPMNYADIVSDLTLFFHKGGGTHNDWFVGIAADPQERLFAQHNLGSCDESTCRVLLAESFAAAECAKKSLLAKPFDHASNKDDGESLYVYLYKKQPGLTIP